MVLSIAHIINPVIVWEASDLYAAQPVTFESMRLAKAYTKGTVAVDLYSAQYQEDAKLVPEWITRTSNLERSVLDADSFQKQRKLPFIKDILDRLYQSSAADYFIYTNVDIALMPHFYLSVAQLIESGVDGMVINRRTIAKTPSTVEQLSTMFAQVGEKHPGYDCFVFKREAYPDFELGTSCIGANWIGKILLANVDAHSKNFKIFENFHLTFHLGDDRSWKRSDFNDYDTHNERQLQTILESFEALGRLEGRPILRGYLDMIHKQQRDDRPVPTRRRWWLPRG